MAVQKCIQTKTVGTIGYMLHPYTPFHVMVFQHTQCDKINFMYTRCSEAASKKKLMGEVGMAVHVHVSIQARVAGLNKVHLTSLLLFRPR